MKSTLDIRIAEKIFGWKQMEGLWYAPQEQCPSDLPQFSFDLNAAWQVTEHICNQGFRMQLDGNRIWQARFYKSVSHTLETRAFSATAKTPAEAICLAALAVLGK